MPRDRRAGRVLSAVRLAVLLAELHAGQRLVKAAGGLLVTRRPGPSPRGAGPHLPQPDPHGRRRVVRGPQDPAEVAATNGTGGMNNLFSLDGWWVVACPGCGQELTRQQALAAVDPPTLDQPCPVCDPAVAPGIGGRVAGWWARFADACDPGKALELNRIGEWRLRWFVRSPVAADWWRRRLWACLPAGAQRQLLGGRVGYLMDPLAVDTLACEVCWRRTAVGVFQSLLDPKVSVLYCLRCARDGREPLRVLLVYAGPRGLHPSLPGLEALEPPARQIVRRSLAGPHADPGRLAELIADEVAVHAQHGTSWAATRTHQTRTAWDELRHAVSRSCPTPTTSDQSPRQRRRRWWGRVP
jgi:hypothetical protein